MDDLAQNIDDALCQRDPSACNRSITLCHYQLSQALGQVLGDQAGANFHSWAVWGSRKAGTTIRQEDLHRAKDDAMRVGAASGLAIGAGLARYLSGRAGQGFWFGIASVVGPVVGAKSAEQMAIWSRKKAARLILHGNKLVINDIGRVSARFCQRFKDRSQLNEENLDAFVSSIAEPLLSEAFLCYGQCALARSVRSKQEFAYFGNCLAILYEHQKLQPFIKSAMPLMVRRCVTKRLLSFEIGDRKLAVSENVPNLQRHPYPAGLTEITDSRLTEFLKEWQRPGGSARRTAADDWSKIEHRMGYIVELFRRFHNDPSVVAPPYPVSATS